MSQTFHWFQHVLELFDGSHRLGVTLPVQCSARATEVLTFSFPLISALFYNTIFEVTHLNVWHAVNILHCKL